MDIEKINVGGTQYDVCDTVARAALSDEFSTGGTYAVGDYCIYENTLYKFTAAKEPGAWDASKVAATQIGDELSELNGNMFNIPKKSVVTLPADMYLLVFSHASQPSGRGIYSYFKKENMCSAIVEASSVVVTTSNGTISWDCGFTPVCFAIRMSY